MSGDIFASSAVQKNTYKEQAFEIIKEAILNHDLQPDRMYSQEELCGTLQISRTPVREALLTLQTEGYVSFLRGRGFTIPALSAAQTAAVHEMRFHGEPIAAGLAAKRINEAQLQALQANIDEMSKSGKTSSEYYKNNRAFHSLIYEASGNYLLHRFLDEIMDWYMFSDPALNKGIETSWRYPVVEEHQHILDALKTHDPENARKHMQTHVDLSLKRKHS